jgi:hypothetical protein
LNDDRSKYEEESRKQSSTLQDLKHHLAILRNNLSLIVHANHHVVHLFHELKRAVDIDSQNPNLETFINQIATINSQELLNSFCLRDEDRLQDYGDLDSLHSLKGFEESENDSMTITSIFHNCLDDIQAILLVLTNRLKIEKHEADSLRVALACKELKIKELEQDAALKIQELDEVKVIHDSEIIDITQVMNSLEVENKAQRNAFLDQSKQIEQLHQDLKNSEEEINLLADEIIQHRHDLSLIQRERDLLQEQLIRLTSAMEDQDDDDDIPLLRNRKRESGNATASQDDTVESSSEFRATELLLDATSDFRKRLDAAKFPSNDYARLSAAGVLIDNALKSEERLEFSHAFRKWSTNSNTYRAVSRHRQVAAVMNEQLRMTQAKLAALKSHFSKSKEGPH